MVIMIASKVSHAGRALTALLLLVVMVSFAADAWAQAGYIHAAPGPVMIQSASGVPVALAVGDRIVAGSAILTGDAGGTVLKFADGMVISLSRNASLRISQYQFAPNNVTASRVSVELLDGGMRFVAGVIAAQNREALRVSVGAYTIAVQAAGGLDFSSATDAKAAPGSVVVAVITGEIALRTPSGAVTAIGSNQVVSQRSGQPPSSPIPLAAAPAAIQAEMAALRSVALPNNAPVTIDTAARAAIVLASAARAQVAAAASPGNTQLQAAAQSTAELASAAVRVMAAATENLIATILEARLSALPATAAGPPPGLTLADLFFTPIVPIPPVVPTTLAALPAAPAGPQPAPVPPPVTPPPGPALPALPVIPVAPIPPVIPVVPIPPVVTTPGQSGCVGSPC